MLPKRHRRAARWAGLACLGLVLACLAAGSPWNAAWAKSKSRPKQESGPKTEDEKLRDRLEGKTPDQKIAILNKILEEGKADKYVYFHLGGARYDKDDASGAAQAFEQAVEMDSTFFKAIVNLADTYDKLQQYPRAIETYERAAALQPDNADVWSHMGSTYFAQKKYTEAIDLYRKALKLQPNAEHALYSMAVAFAEAGIFREAVRYWRRVVAFDSTSEYGKEASENVQLLQKYLVPPGGGTTDAKGPGAGGAPNAKGP